MASYIVCGNRGCLGMRVIAGKYRSRPLRSLRGMDIRPTSDRLRETLFNVLTAGNPAALEGTVWLDLFAGTGAVGIEALSRGAKEVYFVENAAAAADVIRGNLHSLGISDSFKLLQEELPRAFWRMGRPTSYLSILRTACRMRTRTRCGHWWIRRWCGRCRW